MKHIKLLFLCIAVSFEMQAQTISYDSTTAVTNLRTSAQSMGRLFIRKEYDEYVNYIHPNVFRLFGGKDSMIIYLKGILKTMEDQGFTVDSISVEDPPGIIYSGTELEAVVPQILRIKTNSGILISRGYLLAVSTDKGVTWKFIDLAGGTAEEARKIIPSLSQKIVIPERTKPIFYKN